MVVPFKYSISFSIIDFTNLPISSGFLNLPKDNCYISAGISLFSFLNLPVFIGPGAILR